MEALGLNIDVVSKQYYELRSCRAVAEIYGCNEWTINKFLKKNGIDRTGWKNPPKEKLYRFKVTDESKQLIVETFRTVYDVKECAKIVGCSIQTAYRVLSANGIEFYHQAKWIQNTNEEEIIECYTSGHSVRETAERFGATTIQINNFVKQRGISNGRAFKPGFNEKSAQLRDEAEQRLAEILKAKGFDYIGGYTGRECRVIIRCRRCGAEFSRGVDSIRDGNTVCKACQKAETLKRQEEQRRERAIAAELRAKEQEDARKQREIQREQERNAKLDEVFTCKVCGEEYTPRQYMESEGLTLFSNVGYCSHECKRKAMNRLNKAWKRKQGSAVKTENHRHRARKNGCEYDSSVNLKRLIERDGLRCAICGEMCEPNDHRWTKYTGPLSPSMDHIIPMDKGGGHIPENVQVAHIICNSIKGDTVITNESEAEQLAITCREAVRKYQRGFQGTGDNTRKVGLDYARED